MDKSVYTLDSEATFWFQGSNRNHIVRNYLLILSVFVLNV